MHQGPWNPLYLTYLHSLFRKSAVWFLLLVHDLIPQSKNHLQGFHPDNLYFLLKHYVLETACPSTYFDSFAKLFHFVPCFRLLRGPRYNPLGTPLVTSHQSDNYPFIPTLFTIWQLIFNPCQCNSSNTLVSSMWHLVKCLLEIYIHSLAPLSCNILRIQASFVD